jgi:hypothetical protein
MALKPSECNLVVNIEAANLNNRLWKLRQIAKTMAITKNLRKTR